MKTPFRFFAFGIDGIKRSFKRFNVRILVKMTLLFIFGKIQCYCVDSFSGNFPQIYFLNFNILFKGLNQNYSINLKDILFKGLNQNYSINLKDDPFKKVTSTLTADHS